jgi:hypothetical protein
MGVGNVPNFRRLEAGGTAVEIEMTIEAERWGYGQPIMRP